MSDAKQKRKDDIVDHCFRVSMLGGPCGMSSTTAIRRALRKLVREAVAATLEYYQDLDSGEADPKAIARRLVP